MDQSGDNEIANIYERVLKGDKSALNNLEKIKNSPLKKSQKLAQHAPVRLPEAEQISQDLSKASKSQNFRKYLREKVAEFGAGSQPSKKEIVRNQKQSQKKQYAQPKPFSKVRKRSQIKSQQKTGQLPEPPVLNASPNRTQKPPQPKTKTTSNNFQTNMNKNVIKDSATEKDKHSTPPSSKHSFRIRAQGGGSKKLLQELMKLNQDEKRLQSQILHLHKDNKEYIAEVCTRYRIHALDSNYVKVSDNLAEDPVESIDSPVRNYFKQIKSNNLNTEEAKIARLNREIAALSKEIEGKKSEIAKKEAKAQVLPLYTYINSVPDIFEERESEEENEEVAELPTADRKNLDPNKTYQSVMVEMRKKKWGLNQRINYQSQGNKAVNESKQELPKSPPKGIGFSPAKIDTGDDSKIVVNSRLKQFLFE